jgi:uncharacterized protein with GYD domain
MLYCITAQYTPQAISAMLDDPNTNRAAAISNLLEAAGAKLVHLYFYPADGDGPGVMVIFDADPATAPPIAAVTWAGGGVQNLKLTRLFTPDEMHANQQKCRQIRSAYKPPGK